MRHLFRVRETRNPEEEPRADLSTFCLHPPQFTLPLLLETLRHVLQGKDGFPLALLQTLLKLIVLVISTLLLVIVRVQVIQSQLPVFTRYDQATSSVPFISRHLRSIWLRDLFFCVFFPKEFLFYFLTDRIHRKARCPAAADAGDNFSRTK